jgi:hypothetical protein
VVAHGHATAAPAADDQTLEQGGAFTGRAGLAVVAVRGGVGGQGLLVGLVLRPGQVAGMVVVDHNGPLAGGFDQGAGAPVQVGAVAGPPVDVGAGVGGIVQDVQDLVVAQAVPVQLAGVGAAAVAAGEQRLLVTEGFDHSERRAGGSEGFEQQRQGAADARVGVQGHLVAQVVDQPDRQLQLQFPAAGLGQYPAAQPSSQEMEFEFRHLAFEAQQGAVVETGRVIQPVLVQDQGVVVRADLQQPLPVGVVARQSRAFQAKHDPGPAEGDLGD